MSRYYDPNACRFLSREALDLSKISIPLALNCYTYCVDNPVNLSDTDGKDPAWVQQRDNRRKRAEAKLRRLWKKYERRMAKLASDMYKNPEDYLYGGKLSEENQARKTYIASTYSSDDTATRMAKDPSTTIEGLGMVNGVVVLAVYASYGISTGAGIVATCAFGIPLVLFDAVMIVNLYEQLFEP